MKRIVLAHTGDLETSVAIPWLMENYATPDSSGAPAVEVVAVIVDLGRRAGLVELRERALRLGAVRCHVVDVRDEFVQRYVVPALQGGALSDGRSPDIAALARPLVVKTAVELARMEHADAIAFGGSRTAGGAQVATLARALDPALEVIAPGRLWKMSPKDVVAYAESRRIEVPADDARVHESANVWGRSVIVDGPAGVSEDLFTLTNAPTSAPEQPAFVEVEFDAGVPVRVNGIDMLLLEMIESLETIAGAHGVGRMITTIEPAAGAEAGRGTTQEIAEAPASVILSAAHRALLEAVVDPELARLSGELGREYANVIERGAWFSDMRDALDAFSASIQPKLTGSVRLRLFKGNCDNVGTA